MDFLSSYLTTFLLYAKSVILLPLTPTSRIYGVYLVTSLILAFVVYQNTRSPRPDENTSFLRFLFPAKVWNHPSAWLDVRYFFFHQLIGHFLLLGLSGTVTAGAVYVVTGGMWLEDIVQADRLTGWPGIALAFGFMLFAVLVSDFIAFYTHYLQHKIPLLWQFHKVHHSSEVMHPLSNFREHPMDNLVYIVAIGAGYGAVIGLALRAFGYIPAIPSLLGVPIFMFLFNIAGYNLRHSHVWLRWPGVWSMIFPSPAHHHVHHSCHPDHLDKNFAFMFPLWDVLFGCYVMPADNRDVKFGVTEKDNGRELNSCLKLYFLPIRDCWHLLTRKRRPKMAKTPTSDGMLQDQS